MTQKIGPREEELRRQREAEAKQPKPSVKALAANLPQTSGKRPVKRKATRGKTK